MHIKFAPLPVSDQDRAKAFCIRHFSCEVAVDRSYKDNGWRWVELRFPHSETTLLFEPRPVDRPGEKPALVLIDSSPDDVIAALQAEGVEIITEPQEAPWDPGRRFAEFRDSEGNRMVIATR
jgi:predicted enzyme related to lactoylglutathione lyase